MNFDIKVKKILTELYPNEYRAGDFRERLQQLIDIFKKYDDSPDFGETKDAVWDSFEQEVKAVYNSSSDEEQAGIVNQLLKYAKYGDSPESNMLSPKFNSFKFTNFIMAEVILGIILPSADDEEVNEMRPVQWPDPNQPK